MFDNNYYLINNNLYILYQQTKDYLYMINLENNKIEMIPINTKRVKLIVSEPEQLRIIYRKIRGLKTHK